MKPSFSLSFRDSQWALEPEDYGSTLSWALPPLFTSPPPNQPGLLTGASSRRKQAHLLTLKTEWKFLISFQFLGPVGWVRWTNPHKLDEFPAKHAWILKSRQKHLMCKFAITIWNLLPNIIMYYFETSHIFSALSSSFVEKCGLKSQKCNVKFMFVRLFVWSHFNSSLRIIKYVVIHRLNSQTRACKFDVFRWWWVIFGMKEGSWLLVSDMFSDRTNLHQELHPAEKPWYRRLQQGIFHSAAASITFIF